MWPEIRKIADSADSADSKDELHLLQVREGDDFESLAEAINLLITKYTTGDGR